jgi:DNA-nicking Smr family endonuclease
MTGGIVPLDLHGKNQYQARVAIDSALRRAGRDVFRLRLIHGFHGGTALREMIRETYGDHPRVQRVLALDAGTTDLILREF